MQPIFRRRRSLGAFTFPEALVNMGLLLFFVATLGGLYFQGKAFVDAEDHRARVLADKEALVTILPTVCQSILPAEWDSADRAFVQEGDALVAGYWDRDPAQKARFSVAKGTFRVETPTGSREWRTLDQVSVEWWTQDHRIVGLLVRWSEAGAGRALALPWGGLPL